MLRRTIFLAVVISLVFSLAQSVPRAVSAEKKKQSKNFDPPTDTSVKAMEFVSEGEKLMDDAKDKAKEGEKFDKIIKKAVTKFKKASKAAPKWAVPYFHLSICYQWLKKYPLAKKDAEKGLKIKPDFYELVLELADVYSHQKKFDKALVEYARAIKMDPKNGDAYTRRAMVYAKLQEMEKCIADFDKALEDKDLENRERIEKGKKSINMCISRKGWTTVYKKVSKHYVVETSISQAYADEMSEQCEIIYKAYTKVFPKKSMTKDKMKFPVVFHATQRQYVSNGAPARSGGFTNLMTRYVVLFEYKNHEATKAVLYHEAFHQFLTQYTDNPPFWFNEGNAEFFGAFLYIKGKNQMKFRPNGTRLPAIKQYLQRGGLPSLKDMVNMTPTQFYDKRTMGRNYAHAWSFTYFLWMYKNGVYRKYIKKYFTAITKGKRLKEASKSAFKGVNWSAWQREWRAYTMSLKKRDCCPPMH